VGIPESDPVAAMKERAALYAATLVQDGMLVGLGSGSTAALLVRALAERARSGLRFTGIPTSEATARLAASLNLQLATLDDHPRIDLTIDGADEVDPALNLIKGRGGALLREKIVASAADQLAIMVDETKLVGQLGSHAPLPVEVVPFGWLGTRMALEALGCRAERRMAGDQPYITDGGHYVLDCHFGPLSEPEAIASRIKALTGVVDHGLFLAMATTVVVGRPDRVEILSR
jgi:ribose 5-phosphate isomerase A